MGQRSPFQKRRLGLEREQPLRPRLTTKNEGVWFLGEEASEREEAVYKALLSCLQCRDDLGGGGR